jgi:hypothetical protein
MPIPATCPEFVSHPHQKNGQSCYTCQCSSASESQGTSQIAEALNAIGIPADVDQTGGFTMCVYIKTGDESYIYANAEGFSFYCDDECEGLQEFDFREEMTPTEKAQEIADKMKANNLTGQELDK